MERLAMAIDRLSSAVGIVAAFLLAPLIVATVYEVVSRYLFNAPTSWAYEVGYMANGTLMLLGVAYTLKERAHIRIDVLYSMASKRVRALIDVVGYAVLFLPFAWWLSAGLWEYAVHAFERGTTSGESAWNPVVWPFRAMFFASFLLLALQATREFVAALGILLERRSS